MDGGNKTSLFFSPRQSAIIATGLTAIALCATIVCVCGAALMGLKFVSAHSAVLLPPIAAVILAKVLQPLHDVLRRGILASLPKRRRETRSAYAIAAVCAAVVTILAVLVPLAVFVWYFGHSLVVQIVSLVKGVPEFLEKLRATKPDLAKFLADNGLDSFLQSFDPAQWINLESITGEVKDRALRIVGGVPAFVDAVSGWLMLPVYLFIYLLTRPFGGSDISGVMLGTSERTRRNVTFLIDEFIRIVVGFFRGQVLVAIIEGVLFGLGFQFVAHLPNGMLFGLLVGVVNIIPYMGSIFVMPIVSLYAFFGVDGGWPMLIPVLLVWAAVGLADFYITPRVQGEEVGLGTFWVIFSLLFWGSVIGGFAGLFLAVPLSAFIAVIWRLLKKEYFSNERR